MLVRQDLLTRLSCLLETNLGDITELAPTESDQEAKGNIIYKLGNAIDKANRELTQENIESIRRLLNDYFSIISWEEHHTSRTTSLFIAALFNKIDNLTTKLKNKMADEQRREAVQRATEEQSRKVEAERTAEEQRRKAAAERTAEEQRPKTEAELIAEEQHRKAAAERTAEEQRRRAAAERAAEEQRRRAVAERAAEEQRRRATAERTAEKQRHRAAAEPTAEEQHRRAAAERAADEQRRRATAERKNREEQEHRQRQAELREEKRIEDEARAKANPSITKEELRKILANYHLQKGFFRKHAKWIPFMRSETKTISDLETLSWEYNRTTISQNDVLHILDCRERRKSLTRKTGLNKHDSTSGFFSSIKCSHHYWESAIHTKKYSETERTIYALAKKFGG